MTTESRASLLLPSPPWGESIQPDPRFAGGAAGPWAISRGRGQAVSSSSHLSMNSMGKGQARPVGRGEGLEDLCEWGKEV